MTEEVEISELSKSFGKQQVLKDISLSMMSGEITGILGPSGSGKTTLIRLLMGMISPDKGSMNIFGIRVPKLELLKDIGYMSQSDALYEDLSGYDNLVFFACVNGMSSKAAKTNALKVLELVKLENDKDKIVRNYSGGMKRRLSLAIALIHEPKLLVLDEPTVGIDPLLREVFWEEFNRRKEKGDAVIITTHVMDEAQKCDKLVLIREGSIIAYGSPQQLRENTGLYDMGEVFLHYSRSETV